MRTVEAIVMALALNSIIFLDCGDLRSVLFGKVHEWVQIVLALGTRDGPGCIAVTMVQADTAA